MTNRDRMKDMHDEVERMRQEAKAMAEEVRRWQRDFGWSEWEPHTVGVIPMRLNGRWYWKGDTVYRKEKMRYLGSSKIYKYGDEFDVLKEEQE